jgi:hypothetical protein
MSKQVLQPVWNQVEKFLSAGVSVIPVRDRPQLYKGKEYTVKSAYPWAKWQKEIISKDELFYNMTEKFDTTAIGIVGGAVSGNLEIIDIDVKNWPGIDAKLFQELNLLYPVLFASLRIHKTPSGGYHIFYRVSNGIVPGNKKLARKEGQKEAALETRGEGGYVVAPPSMGYTIHQDNEIPVITWEDRCSIISICESFNQVHKKPVSSPATKKDNDYFSVNPFEDFNQNSEAESVLINNGWSEHGRSSRFIWYTRPDKGKGVSASFNLVKRIFYIFTSSTEFEPDRGYNPASVLSILQHAGDRKQTFLYLTQKGYGKVKSSIEKQIVEKNGRTGKPLPANFSPEAKQSAQELHDKITTLHPFGVFWSRDDENKIKISRELMYNVADQLGFRYHAGNVVRIIDKFIHRIDERQFQDYIKCYIQEPEPDEYNDIADAYEAFMQRNGAFTMKRLLILDTTTVLADTENVCFKFYRNGYLAISPDNISFLEYDQLEALVWIDKVQGRDYNRHTGGLYVDYLNKALVSPEDARRIIGYLSHEYKDETTGYIIVLTEQCPDPKDGGGSGKNVFCNLLSNTTSYTSKPGVQAKMDEKFFQSWNGQRIFGISDVPKNFDFSFLKEPSTGSFIWKKLFKDEVEVANEDAPKFIVQTNFSYEVTDGGLRRRIIPIEFTDFFTRCGGLDVHYKMHFPKGWSVEDWGGFDTYIAEAIQSWMNAGRKLHPTGLTETGWEKQFQHTYGSTTYDFILQHFSEWVKLSFIANDIFKGQLNDFYSENDIAIRYHVSTKKLYEAIDIYCKKNKIVFLNNQMKRNGLDVIKGKIFNEEAPF